MKSNCNCNYNFAFQSNTNDESNHTSMANSISPMEEVKRIFQNLESENRELTGANKYLVGINKEIELKAKTYESKIDELNNELDQKNEIIRSFIERNKKSADLLERKDLQLKENQAYMRKSIEANHKQEKEINALKETIKLLYSVFSEQ